MRMVGSGIARGAWTEAVGEPWCHVLPYGVLGTELVADPLRAEGTSV